MLLSCFNWNMYENNYLNLYQLFHFLDGNSFKRVCTKIYKAMCRAVLKVQNLLVPKSNLQIQGIHQ